MKFNLNDAPVADRDFVGTREPIPEDEEVDVIMHLVTGDDDETENLLTISNDGGSKYLKVNFVVVGGPHNKRQWWEQFYLVGPSEEAYQISITKLRAITEAVLGISPTDMSPAAMKQRDRDLNELNRSEFRCVVGIKPGSKGYRDQNTIKRVINPAETGTKSAKVASPKAPGKAAPPPKNGKAGGKPAAWA